MEFEELNPQPEPAAPPPMTQEQAQEAFEPMQFAGSSITLPSGCYRVFTSDDDFIEVEANSAYEAMGKADVENPLKIERFSISRMAVLTQDILANGVSEAQEDEADKVEDNTSESEPAESKNATELPTEEDAETRGLEGDEVDALLDGEQEAQQE